MLTKEQEREYNHKAVRVACLWEAYCGGTECCKGFAEFIGDPLEAGRHFVVDIEKEWVRDLLDRDQGVSLGDTSHNLFEAIPPIKAGSTLAHTFEGASGNISHRFEPGPQMTLVKITSDEMHQANNNFTSYYGINEDDVFTLQDTELWNFLGHPMDHAPDKAFWLLNEEVACKIKMLLSPHWRTLLKIQEIKSHAKAG